MAPKPDLRDGTISRVPTLSLNHFINRRRFHVFKTLGKGSFATVMLVRKAESKNGELYALKVISKDALTHPHHIQHVKDERDVLRSIPPHPNILRLNETFSDQTRLFFTLEYFEGGTMHQLMERFLRPLTEKEAKFYAIQIARGLQHLHDHDIIYRDLKPENIVIRETGQIALCDFGFSKSLKDQDGITSTFCGSPDFMAPELIKANSQTNIIPDQDLTTQEKFARILKGIYAFPFKGNYTNELIQRLQYHLGYLIEGSRL